MELFSLLAKLTLNTAEYYSALNQAKSDANVNLPDPSLGLDTTEFDAGIQEAENTDVSDPEEPELGLDPSEFDAEVDAAENTDVSDPEDPELGLDSSEFKSGIEEAESLSESFGSIVSSVFEEIKGSLAAAGITAAVAGFVSFLKEGIDLARQNGDAIDKQSQKLNLSTKAYQELDYALRLSGASVTDLTRAMRTFTEIQGGKATDDQIAALEKLGISATDASGKVKSAQQLMEESLYALSDYGGADRGVLTEALFGRNSAGLNALLNSGSDKIREMREEANDLGLVMTEEEIKNAAAYNDALTRLDSSINALKENFASGVLPLLTDAANTVAKIVAFFNGRTGDKSLADQWAGDDKAFAEELITIEGTAAAAETLADKLLAMGETSKMTAEQYEMRTGTAQELIGLVPDLGEVIDTETGKINGNSDSIRENIKEWENLAKQKALQELKEKRLQSIYEKNQELIDKTIAANRKEADAEKARTEAYHNFSDTMKTLGYGELDFTGDVDAQISALMDKLADLGDSGEADALKLGASLKKLGEAKTALTEAQNAVNSLKQELAKEQQDYEEWEAAADEMFGGLKKDADTAKSAIDEVGKAFVGIPDSKILELQIKYSTGFPQAKGNWNVPYDNYPSLLHRDEMVLTASDARRYREGNGGNVDYIYIGEMIGDAINSAMGKINVMMSGEKVGDLTSKPIDRNIKATTYARQRALGG